ncbi:MAG: AraC family transcriptional regulator ligand-binding domain-containing protein [Pseudomonadota bacterium]
MPVRLTQGWYEADTPCIRAHYQPAMLLDLATSRGVDTQHALKGTHLTMDALHTPTHLVAPHQLITLMRNCRDVMGVPDIGFLMGQNLLPGSFGPASRVIQHAGSLRELITGLQEFNCSLAPLGIPRIYESESHAVIYWLDSFGRGELGRFLVELQMYSLVSAASWLSRLQLPWTFRFSYPEPSYVEQYWVHFGDELAFDQQMNAAMLPRRFLDTPWDAASPTVYAGALRDARSQQQKDGFTCSFYDGLYDYLCSLLQHPLSLDRLSAKLLVSPASLKRKLRKNDTNYQSLFDLARKNTAIRLYEAEGYSSQRIAEFLRFSDMNNFRRSVKRWTGSSPHTLFA